MTKYIKAKELRIGSVFFIEYGCYENYTEAVITNIKLGATGSGYVCKYRIPAYDNQEGECAFYENELVKTTCLYKAVDTNNKVLYIGTYIQVYNFIFKRKKLVY